MTDDDVAALGDLHARPAENPIPFPSLRANTRLAEAWIAERDRVNKKHGKTYRLVSPLDALDDLMRKRALPELAWPSKWPEIGKRCRLFAGECVGIVGPTGGGKTSFAIELARAAASMGTPVVWAPIELDAPEVNLRLVANSLGLHTGIIRDRWTREQIERQLAAISDLWHYVDKVRDADEQIAACRAAVQIAKRIYQRPPLLIVDYIGKLSSVGARDPRHASRDHAEQFREMTLEEECYSALLAQPSRSNNSLLTGQQDIAAASDAIAVAAESSEIEHACSVMIALNVFKADDSPILDVHALITKARGTGREGREGMRFGKAGGVWSELGFLPATPAEIKTEVARAKKDKSRIASDVTPERAREDINVLHADTAEASRKRYLRETLRRAGARGIGNEDMRFIVGVGRGHIVKSALADMERTGEVERIGGPRWRLAPGRHEEQGT